MKDWINNKRKSIIRFLSGISLLIFFLPFFQMCSDENIKTQSSFIKSYSMNKAESDKERAFREAKKDFSLTGYDLAMSIEPIFLSFTLVMFVNIALLVCFLRRHYNQLLLCFINSLLIIISMIVLSTLFWSLSEIRYGLYLCLMNSLGLLYFVYKEQEEL